MGKAGLAALIALGLLICGVIGTVVWYVAIDIPAGVDYNRAFGSDVTMAVYGATTLTGPESIQDYVNRIWVDMNATFDMRNAANIYNSGYFWDFIPENTMLKQNSYFQSLNTSINQRQALVDSVIEKGNYFGTDPIQTAINQTRYEMNAYGGLDWVIKGAWFLQYAPLAYWSPLYAIIFWAVIGSITSILLLYAMTYDEW